jgi:hypothetical protein
LFLGSKNIDRRLIDGVRNQLIRQDTGMHTYAAILYFLEKEMELKDKPVSLVVFELQYQSSTGLITGKPQALSPSQLAEVSMLIHALKGPRDLVGHWDPWPVAVILPNTLVGAAMPFASRVVTELLAKQQNLGFTNLAVGVASAPEDFMDMAALTAGADKSVEHSLITGNALIHCRDVP